MEYSQKQVRSVVGLAQQTLRYWKGLLPPLACKTGKVALFTVGEMLALSVVNQLVHCNKVDVSAITPVAEELFELCSRPLLFSRYVAVMWIDLREKEIVVVRDPKDLPTDRVYLVVPVSQLWLEISEKLTNTDGFGEQKELLPLASVG